MLLNREPKEGDVIFARACMADFAISALGTYLRKQEVLRRPKPHSIARILDSLIQDFGMVNGSCHNPTPAQAACLLNDASLHKSELQSEPILRADCAAKIMAAWPYDATGHPE